MKTQIKKAGDTLVVSINGKLDFEASDALKQDLGKIMRENGTDESPRKIIFNMEKLDFVGSSGISSFVQALKEFNAQSPTRPRYCSVKSEFQKVIKAFDESDGFEFFDNEERAKKSFDQ